MGFRKGMGLRRSCIGFVRVVGPVIKWVSGLMG
jgi:hypothetical protein